MADTILVQGYTSLVPLIEALDRQGRYQVAIWDNFDKNRLSSPVTLEHHIEKVDARRQAFMAEVFPQVKQVFSQPAFRAQFQWRGKDILEPVQEQFLEALYRTQLIQAGVVDGFRLFWEEHQPKLVVLSNDTMVHTKLLTQVARQLGVPVLHVLHGSPAADYGLKLFADHLAVFGERDRQQFIEVGGIQSERITVTGAMGWDYCATLPETVDREAVRAKLNIPQDRPCVLFLSTWVHALSPRIDAQPVQEAYVAAIEGCRSLGPATLLVRPHPAVAESGRGHVHLAKQLGYEEVRLAEGELKDWLVASDVVLCFDSNAGIEALLLDRPVITLRFPPWRAHLFTEADGVAIATNASELTAALSKFLTDDGYQAEMRRRRKEAIPRFNDLNDGHALDRLTDLVDQLVEKGRKQVPRLAVAMRAKNQLDPLKACLEAWQGYDLLVVDAGSTDGTQQWLRENGIPWLEGTGTEDDLTRAWEATTGEWLLFADGPIEPVLGRWERLMVRLHDPKVAAIAPQVVGEDSWAGIGWLSGGKKPFGQLLDPADERAKRVWRVGACAGGVRLVRRGSRGEGQLYCPDFQVRAKGWEPRENVADPAKVAPIPLW